MSPCNVENYPGLLKAAVRDNNPVVCSESKLMYNVRFDDVPDTVMDPDFALPSGKSKVIREGTGIISVAHSRPVGFPLQAAEILIAEGISA